MDDVAAFTYLIATIDRDDDQVAWIFDRLESERTIVRIGDEFTIGSTKYTLEEIFYNRITLKSGEDQFQLTTGKNFRQKKALPRDNGNVTEEISKK